MDIIERLDKGLFDFAILLGNTDISKYDSVRIPVCDIWGVLMRKDSPLAGKESICAQDLWDKPLIVSRQGMKRGTLAGWMKRETSKLNIVATYNLVYNASLMVDEGMGYALTLDKLINTTGESSLCFRPLEPKLEIGMNIVWKKYQPLTKASEKFLECLRLELHSAAQS